MVIVDYFLVKNKDETWRDFEFVGADDNVFEFCQDDDRVAFEEKIGAAFRQCVGDGYEVFSVGLRK
jgi:hypothetical protein